MATDCRKLSLTLSEKEFILCSFSCIYLLNFGVQQLITGQMSIITSHILPLEIRFHSQDLVDHHKLAPHGERGVFLGLGMSHCCKCWLVYALRLNSIFASRNVTFDDTLYQLKDCYQLVYGYYNNTANTQMSADAYCLGINDTPLADILRSDPISTDINCNFNSLTDQEISSSTGADIYLWNVHLAVLQAQKTQDNVIDSGVLGGVTEAHGGKGSIVGVLWGDDVEVRDHRGHDLQSVGQKRDFPDVVGPLHSLLTSALCEHFGEAPPPVGQPIKHWWDCESVQIATVSDSELWEFLIGHSTCIQFPAYYWPNAHIKREYNCEALQVVEDDMYPGQAVLKCLISICKGKPFTKGAKAQIAYLPISKSGPEPDISIQN
eukprot:1982588-Rhodomonas_salina.1